MAGRTQRRRTTLLAVLLAAAPAWSPAQDDPASKSFLTISPIAGPAGSEVMLPFYLSLDPEERLNSLVLTLDFGSELTSFLRFDAGLVTEMAGLQVDHELAEDESPAGSRTARLRLTLSLEKHSPGTFPSGLLGYLVFEISPRAPEGTLIPLAATARGDGGGSSLQSTRPLVVSDGEITVGPPVVYSCFFYLH